MIFKKIIVHFCLISKMNKSNSLGAIDRADSEQTKFRLDEISKIENYFIEEIKKENHAVKN